MQYLIFFIKFDKRPDDGSQLEPKHVAVNKFDINSIACNSFEAFELLTRKGMSRIKIMTATGRRRKRPWPTLTYIVII
jgi:hypothetical protein